MAFVLLASSWAADLMAANKKTTVTQVATSVTVSDDVDYTVTSATPFGENGIVNITNTEHAVLILSNVRPSSAKSLLAKHVQINGARAVDNNNCQVKLYNRGCIILPYSKDLKPLTVYSEQNFEGESCNDFGTENSGGYMNTLTEAKLNNKIRSFKLKRGYMVTFSLLPGGRGYSRCFIAADKDLEVAELPVLMDQRISSYRVFKWYDAGKKQLANCMDKTILDALNVQSSYDWGQGNSSFLPDYEWVPNHIYEDWPSSSTIGGTSQSPHCKNNNEPRNSADDHPQDLATILGNWENMMRTGLRLCSPASWDGSDYWNATGFLAEFMDSIDARGWRCDIIDLHCYWTEGSFDNIINWVNKYKRPVWISEWCWGASWNNNGAFANGATEASVKSALQNICSKLNGFNYVERYFYWNGERNPSRLYTDKLTPAGEYYAGMTSPMAYNGKYDFVPKTPKQHGITKFTKTVNNGVLRLSWYDANGELNQKMEIERKDETGKWVTYKVVEQKESAATYTVDITENIDDDYRVCLVDLNGKTYYTSDDLTIGDQIDFNGKTLYVGGNMFVNSDFNYGFYGWKNGKGADLADPAFQVIQHGGIDNGAYLQAYSNGDINSDGTVRMPIEIEAGKDYYFRSGVMNGSVNMRFCLSINGNAETKNIVTMKPTTSWERISATFNSDTYSKALLAFRNLASKAKIDKVELRRLFESREEAVANGIALLKKDVEAAKAFNTKYPALNEELTLLVDGYTSNDDAALSGIESALDNHLTALRYMAVVDSLNTVLDKLTTIKCVSYDEMLSLLNEAVNATSASTVINNVEQVKELMDTYLYFENASVQPKSPKFASATGWETKVGTYTGGDQRTNTAGGKTCWNAWWSLSAASNPDATMEIRQKITAPAQGLYTLECKSTTEHFCLSDQHAYIKCGDKSVESPALTYDYFDTNPGSMWETLTTAPIHVNEGDEITIGFIGSKHGATDGKWHAVGSTNAGDNREGWWCATDFVLKYHPAYCKTVVPGQWGCICLPYKMRSSEGLKFYEIVGITPDYTQLCLSEIDEVEAGVPCIFRSDVAETYFLEYGKAVTDASYGPGNLVGYFKSSSSVRVGYYYLNEGAWTKVTESANRPKIGNYTAIMYSLDNQYSERMPLLEDWQGLTMPIIGVTDAEKAVNGTSSIVLPVSSLNAEGYYSLDGRMITGTPQQGVYIKVENGTVRKVVVR